MKMIPQPFGFSGWKTSKVSAVPNFRAYGVAKAIAPCRGHHQSVAHQVLNLTGCLDDRSAVHQAAFSFTDFSAVWLLTQGGPYNTTHVFGTYAYNIGINAGDLGMGAAITLFIFPFLALTVIFMLRFLKRD